MNYLNQLLQKYSVEDQFNKNEAIESLESKCFQITF